MASKRLEGSIAVALCMLLIASCTFGGATETNPNQDAGKDSNTNSSQDEVSQDEYDVYRAVLKARFVRPDFDLLVIEDHTGIDQVGEGTEDIAQSLDKQIRLVKSGMSANQEALEDFQHKNSLTYPLQDNFYVGMAVIMLSQQERAGVQPGSNSFYEKYPKSRGLIILSRVGFNKNHNRAVVYIGNQWGSLAGAGSYIALGKRDGKWHIQDEFAVWIS